jgi:hypothetical protein
MSLAEDFRDLTAWKKVALSAAVVIGGCLRHGHGRSGRSASCVPRCNAMHRYLLELPEENAMGSAKEGHG